MHSEKRDTQLILTPDAAIDLQMHTIYSDGTWTPQQLLDYLKSEQFGLAAITDHDRVDTAAELQQLAAERYFPLLVAVEISTRWRGEATDILCYGFDPEHEALRDLTQDVTRRQRENTRQTCENLRKNNLSIPQDELDLVLAAPSAQQPHALVALLEKPDYGSGAPDAWTLIKEAGFSWAISEIAAVVEAGHHSGGVCFIAHPGRGEGFTLYDADALDELRHLIPIDGIEAYYPLHTPEQTAMYHEYAEQHGLLTSSGSDSHGPGRKPIKYRAALSRRLLERLGIQVS